MIPHIIPAQMKISLLLVGVSSVDDNLVCLQPLLQISGPSRLARNSSLKKPLGEVDFHVLFCSLQTLLSMYFCQWRRCHQSHWSSDHFQKTTSNTSTHSCFSNVSEKLSAGQIWVAHSFTFNSKQKTLGNKPRVTLIGPLTYLRKSCNIFFTV